MPIIRAYLQNKVTPLFNGRTQRFVMLSTLLTFTGGLLGYQRDPVIDLSSTERYLLSLQRIKSSLTAAQSMAFDTAIKRITQYEVQAVLQHCGSPQECTKQAIDSRLHSALHGRSANDIIAFEQQYR